MLDRCCCRRSISNIWLSILVIVAFHLCNNTVCLGANVEVEPREVLVLPGQNVSVMCRLGVPLQYCRIAIPGMKTYNLNSKLANDEVAYYGSGLSAGQCGVTIKHVNDQNNGLVKCYLGVETDPVESLGQMQLIVARAPKQPELDLSRGTDSLRVYKINDLLQASCIVRDGRPVANISWYLDDELLYRDGLSMPTVIDLAKENLQSKLQNLTRILQPTDNGRYLRCVAHHPAYQDGYAETKRQLDVKYAPLPLPGDIDKFGYILGQPGMITVQLDANPKPQIEWDIGGERIKEGGNDQTGRLEAEAARDLGNGRYNVTLRIAAIKKDDTEKFFVLHAYNNMGSQEYTVKISTSPEPEGLELGIGGIVGIIVALMFIILVVSMLIFAKITSRWCFSDGQESRHFGETSDTESADVRPETKRNFPIIKLTSFFKKTPKDREADAGDEPADDNNTDRATTTDNTTDNIEPKQQLETTTTNETQHTQQPPPPPPEQEQQAEKPGDNLVYAELDLVSPNLKPIIVKNDDDKTEYAEIVYTPKETTNN